MCFFGIPQYRGLKTCLYYFVGVLDFEYSFVYPKTDSFYEGPYTIELCYRSHIDPLKGTL